MHFPYGKAALFILIIAIVTGLINIGLSFKREAQKPDLVFALFAPNHVEAYEPVIAEFEKKHQIKILLQLVDQRTLQSKLQASLLTGTAVPDMVELLEGTMGYFTKGPLEDVGFVDLTDRLKEEGLYERIVQSRFSLWSSRGRIFALPHDVHPIMLCYRKDLVDELGIDVSTLKTWDDFAAMGRRIRKDLDGDGNSDVYALDLSLSGSFLPQLIFQQGAGLFDAKGNVTFDTEDVADIIIWYIHQTRSDERIAFDAGWGQNLAKVMKDGLVLFYFCPDWRTKQFQMDLPKMKGKLALMPLPAWKPGGRRTTTWGGTGLAITKACEKQELAWELAKELYFKKAALGRRFESTNIIPPLMEAWDLPEFKQENEFFSGQPIGLLYAELAPETPPVYVSPYSNIATTKLSEAMMNSAEYYLKNGDEGLKDYTMKELTRCADYVRKLMDRNVFLKAEDS